MQQRLKSSSEPGPSAPCDCETCGDRGVIEVLTIDGESRFLDRHENGNSFLWDNPRAQLSVMACHCQQTKLAQRQIDSIMNGDAQVPAEFRGCTFETWDALPDRLKLGKDTARITCEYFAESELYNPETNETKYGLVLAGPVGTSKSGLASAALTARAGRGQSVLWIDFRHFLRKVRATYERDHETTYDEIITAATNVGCLLFDDFGDAERDDRPVTDNVREICYDVIGERYNQHRATIITTNLTPEQMREQFGDRLVSRIMRICYWQQMGGENIRNQHDGFRSRRP